MTKATTPNTPTLYQIAAGSEYNQLTATATSDSLGLPSGYTSFAAGQLATTTFLVAFNSATKAADSYQLQPEGQGLTKQATANLKAAYASLTTAAFNDQQYVMGYDPASGNFDFYQLSAGLALAFVYSFSGPTELTTTSLFTYRGALYFIGYNTTTGAVAYYQVTAQGSGISAAQIWTDTWAQGWVRFTFFQMAMENFFFKTNTKYINCNIDHIMDDPTTGSHPVGTKLPLSQDLDVVQAFYFAGDAYFATYVASSGAVTLNRFLASGQGWVEGDGFTSLTGGSAVVPLAAADASYLLLYG